MKELQQKLAIAAPAAPADSSTPIDAEAESPYCHVLDAIAAARKLPPVSVRLPSEAKHMSDLDLLNPLLRHLTPLLKKHGFKRSTNDFGIAVYSRESYGDFKRIGIDIKSRKSKNGEFEFGVALGIEFGDFERTNGWIGIPNTHQTLTLGTLNRKANNYFVCSDATDWRKLAGQLSTWLCSALTELESRTPRLKRSYIASVETKGRNRKQRLAIFAERKRKELRKRKPMKMKAQVSSITDTLNIFSVASKLLRARNDKVEELESYEFTDDVEAHDESVTRRKHEEFIEKALALKDEMNSAHLSPEETGDTEHRKIPVNGVLYFSYWQVGWKILYLVVNHEDIGLPVCLLMGTCKIEH